jgi:dTDP-4-dehydrorhamnose 3,5-epimerase
MARDLPDSQQGFGEIYASTSENGAVRGNHYHRRTTEWFVPLHGLGELVLVGPEGQRMSIILDRANPVRVKVPPGVAHAFRALDGSALTLLAYSDLEYDPKDTDTFSSTVL